MKKKIVTVEIKTDKAKKAKREARVLVGIPKPARVIAERQAPEKKPKHKKPIDPANE